MIHAPSVVFLGVCREIAEGVWDFGVTLADAPAEPEPARWRPTPAIRAASSRADPGKTWSVG